MDNVFKKSVLDFLREGLAALLFTLIIAAVVIFGLARIESATRSEGRRLLEDSIRSAVVRCYTIEGRYPESISYIQEHYGVHVDSSRYAVFYEVFAPNLIPIVRVTEIN